MGLSLSWKAVVDAICKKYVINTHRETFSESEIYSVNGPEGWTGIGSFLPPDLPVMQWQIP